MALLASTIPASELGDIYHETAACILAFENCLSVEPLMEEDWAESRLADLKLWASSVGALAHPRSSLDRRLEFQPNPRLVLISLLRTLQEFVNICQMLASAQISGEQADKDLRPDEAFALPKDGTLAPTIGSDSGGPSFTAPSAMIESDPETDSTISIDSDASERSNKDQPRSMLQKGMRSTEGVLYQLMMLGYTIRKSGTVARLRKADSSFNPDFIEAIGKLLGDLPLDARDDSLTILIEQKWRTFSSHATQCPPIDQVKDLQVFREHLKFILTHDSRRRKREMDDKDIARDGKDVKNDEDITSHDRMQEAKDDSSDLSPKQHHLVLANLRRRHRFVYAKRHQQKLDRAVVPQRELRAVSVVQVPKPREDFASGNSRPQAVPDRSVPTESLSRETPPLESSVSMDMSATDPSAVEGKILLKTSLISQDTASHVSVSVARLHYPSPPKNEKRKWFKCPCCSQTLPEMFRDKSRWRNHVSEDLCPYTCPFEDCSNPEVLYISRAAWREHVLAAHGTNEYWECLACAGTGTPNTFSTADELVVHATTNHKDTMSEDLILDLRNWGRKTALPNISTCPLCPWPRGLTIEPDAAANLEHVANCIHEFSLRALPWAEVLETRIPSPSKRSTAAEKKIVEWFEMIKEEIDDEDIEDISIDETSIEIIPIQDVDISKIDITSFHALPDLALPRPQAAERSYLPQDYFDESSDESSQAERASSPAGSDLPEVKESDAGDFAPSRPYSPTNNPSSLKDLIFSHLEKNCNEEIFLPADCIYDFTREKFVQQELSRVVSARNLSEEFVGRLISFASGLGKRIFLILVYCDCIKYLELIFLSGFDDTGLPIGTNDTKKALNSVVFSLDKSSYQVQKPGAALDCFDTLAMRDLRAFIQVQWLFLAPIFSSVQFLYNLHPQQPLPFLIPHREYISGKITKVRVHDAHFPMLGISMKPVMAVTVRGKDSKHQSYEIAIAGLRVLQRLKHGHIMEPFVAYERYDSLHTLVPWANGGNLSDFWSCRHDLVDGPRPPTPTVILWALEQMRGLAAAISTLHDNQMLHGGLSPYSVLVVDDHKYFEFWTLKIDSSQLSRFIPTHAGGRATTTSKIGAFRYAAPELSTIDSLSLSRSIDIWSIGCIYLEFLIWILDGNVGLREFRGSDDDIQYCDFKDGELRIHQAVESWIDPATKCLENHDQETGSALLDLSYLIRQDLLVTMPTHRINTAGLMNKITEIHQKARETPGYLYDPKVWEWKRRPTLATLTVPTQSDVPQLSPQDRVPSPPGTGRDDDSLPPTVISVIGKEGKKLAKSEPSGSVNPDNASHSTLRDPFAERILRKIDWSSEPEVVVPDLCERCRALDLFNPDLQFKRTISYLRDNLELCGLCRMLFSKESLYSQDDSPILFQRKGPYVKHYPGGFVLCVIYTDPESMGKILPQTLPGIPMLPVPAGSTQQLILKEWLQECDREHNCHRSSTSRAQDLLPTRLLDIGNDTSSIIRLVDEPSEMTRSYIALSFARGSQMRFRTVNSNYEQRRRGIVESELPATILDAIRIARSLGIRYLWVDALCIICDNNYDFEAAMRGMEGVFSSAYCRLAAASSRSVNESMISVRCSRACLRVQDSEGRSIYISQFIDYFSQDVDGSILNGRAWVLQERALSCRTIYFTSAQVYMECGEGVRCETLGRIPRNEASFLGDSHFPIGALQYFGGSGILLYQNLYQLYSGLHLTVTKDKPKAIETLEKRLALALDTAYAYGIVERYLSSSLMWVTKTDQGSHAAQIHQPPEEGIPSWSWMAYNRPIEYFSTASGEMEVNTDISSVFRRFFDDRISTKETKLSRIELTVPARKIAAPLDKWLEPNAISDFRFDEVRDHSPDRLLCVPISREKRGSVKKHCLHWIILIEQIWDIDNKEVYRRVGVGSLAEEYMNADTVFVQLW